MNLMIDELPPSLVLKSLADSVDCGIIVVDRAGRIILHNRAAGLLTGLDERDALSRPIDQVFPKAELLRAIKACLTRETVRVMANGSVFLVTYVPISMDEELRGATLIFRDISAYENVSKELEGCSTLIQELKKMTGDLELIVESSNDGLYVTDGKGITLGVNSTYEEITGIKADEVVGRHMKDLVDEGFFSESVTLHVLNQSKPQAVTRLQRLRNGRYVISTGKPVLDDAGNIYRVVTNVRDVTHFLNLQRELERVRTALERYKQEATHLRSDYLNQEDVVARSKQMCLALEMAKQVAPYPTSVLVTGESGVGKEIVARLLHIHSTVSDGPFIKLNCGAIPENLIESELFGYEAGAFTGAARKGKPGMLELADFGTLFLDEIGELAFDLQVKLLQVLQDQQITRLGGTSSRKINVRFIAATNKDLLKMVEKNLFRADLYYRLNVVSIHVPPLRERRDDIPPLVLHYLEKYRNEYQLSREISTEAMQCFCDYDWPGNVRELKNAIENLVVMVKGGTIHVEHLPPSVSARQHSWNGSISVSRVMPIKEAVDELERKIIALAVGEFGTIRKAAKALRITHSTLLRKMKRW